MDKGRVEAIRTLGDRLAEYIQHRDRRLFNNLHFARNYDGLRLALVRAARDGWSPDDKPILTLDLYARVFEEEDETASLSWRLARDILMIRVCEKLYEGGWFVANRDVVDALQQAEAEGTTE